MPTLFPPEIIADTTESLFVKRSVHSKAIYLVVVFAVSAALAALPFIYVQVSTQARGIIRTPNENNQLQTSVYGEVTDIRISENAEVVRLKKIHEDSVYPFFNSFRMIFLINSISTVLFV